MTSIAFQKFKSLERSSRPSPDQGLGSSVSSSSSTASLQSPTVNLQSPSLKREESNSSNDMAQLRAQFFKDTLTEQKVITKNEKERPPPPKCPPPVLDRRKSADETSQSVKLDAMDKGIAKDIKGMFEENIAIKKGLIPDPNVPQGPVVKMRRKVNPNIKHLQKNAFGRNEDDQPNKNRESIPIDKKLFSQFMNKFEDDQSRQAAKNQTWKIIQKQKDYNQKKSWSQKQEEKRLEEEKRALEEIARIEEEARLKAEEEERLRKIEEEKLRQIEEEELRKAQEAAEAAAAAATFEEKKKKKKVKKKAGNETKELPNLNLVSNTCSDLRRKFQELKTSNDTTKDKPIERPKARKLIQNPFEKQTPQISDTASVKKREFPAVRENRLGDIKKRFSQFMNTEPVNIPAKSENEVTDEQRSNVQGTTDQTDCKQDNLENSSKTNIEPSPAQLKRKSMLQNSVEVLKGSLEKIGNSKERLSDAFQKKQKRESTLVSRPSKSDMQSYLISHVLYDGQVHMETLPSKEEEEEDFMEKLERELQEIHIPEEELLNDEYIKGLQKYLSLFEDNTSNKKGKKKKKKKKLNDTPQQQPSIKTVEVGSIKEQFEMKKKNAQPNIQRDIQDPVLTEPTVGKVKNLFESNMNGDNSKISTGPVRTRSKMISNDLIQKFDCPEKVEELKRQRDEEREKRKQERLQKLEEERLKIEAEKLKAKKLEEERLEKERQELLKKEEEERLEKERKEEEARYKAAFEKMMEEEKRKAEERNKHDLERKEQREKAEPAFRQKKVLGRIQNLFQKKLEEEEAIKSPQKIGSVKDKANELFNKKDDISKSQNDAILNGGVVLNTVKSKFETKEEEPIALAHGVPKKKKDIPAALTFAINEQKQLQEDAESSNNKPKQETDWSWKKKDPVELAVESTFTKDGSLGNPLSKTDSKKELKLKKTFDRQRELLDDIHAVSERLSKKNALKEHEAKMEDLLQYLVEPDQSTEEASFKDDIKNFINSKVAKKKPKAKVAPSKTEVPSNTVVNKIKQQLRQGSDAADEKLQEPVITGGGKIDALRASIIQQYLGDSSVKNNQFDQDVDVKNSVNSMKEMFELDQGEENNNADRTKVKKKIIQVKEPAQESPVQKKNSYEWKYKKKSIQELQTFISSNKGFVSENISDTVENVADLLEEAAIEENTNAKEAIQIQGYSKMMDQVEQYLNAPDKSKEEIEFKEQLEKYLDTVEMPSKEKETFNYASLTRKPKKLNLSLYIKNTDDDDAMEKDDESSPTVLKSKESTTVKELQNKLFNSESTDQSSSSPKDIIINKAGTNSLKRGFEKLNKQEEQVLYSAPKIMHQKFFGDYINTNSGKSLEELKAEGKDNTWKWKQKTIGDLHTYISGHLSTATKEIVESHKNILKADIEIQNQQSTAKNIETIKRLTKERDDEMEKFLENIKDYVEIPSMSSQENSLKYGIQSYLNLIEEGNDKKDSATTAQVPEKKFLRSGQVSYVLDQLQAEEKEESIVKKEAKSIGTGNTSLNQRRSDVAKFMRQRISKDTKGKVDASFLSKSENKEKQTLHIGVSRHEDVKEQLVKQFFTGEQNKEAPKSGAPKTKLVRTPSDPIGSKPKPIEPKRVWKPPVVAQPKPLLSMGITSQEPTKEKPKDEPKKFVSKYAHITDEKEKEAAILAQFGVKPRSPKVERKSSSSSLSSMDSEADMKNYIENDLMKNNDLYVIYGDRLRENSPKRKSRKQKDSVDMLKGIFGQMRNHSTSRHDGLDSSSDSLSMEESTPDGPGPDGIPGSCKRIRSRFEQKSHFENHNKGRTVEKSRSISNVGSLFQETVKEKTTHVPSYQPVPNIGRVNMPSNQQKVKPTQTGFLPGKNQLAKSASFHKFKQSFETGQFDSEDEYEDEDIIRTTDQRSLIEAELDEIRSNTRLQKMFNINQRGSTRYSAIEKSSSSSAVPEQFRAIGDEDEDIPTVKEARDSIKNIFEASAFKVTYGGGKTLSEQVKESEKIPEPQPKKKVQFSDRTWVMDTINKYFDVIDEDEEADYEYEEGEDEDDEEEEYSDDSEEDNAVFATQVSAQRFVYPSAIPQNATPSQSNPHIEKHYQQNNSIDQNIQIDRLNYAHAVPAQSNYSLEYESEEDDEDDEEDEENLEDEYEVELEVSDEEEDLRQQNPHSTSLLQKSASSSRIRGLFQTVLQKSASGAGLDVSNFKANLHTHLRRRQSITSNTNIHIQSDSDDDDDQFEDCSEVPLETAKYYRIPL